MKFMEIRKRYKQNFMALSLTLEPPSSIKAAYYSWLKSYLKNNYKFEGRKE